MAKNNNPADWYEDPTGRHQLRYWDGKNWTDNVADNGVQGSDPMDEKQKKKGFLERQGEKQAAKANDAFTQQLGVGEEILEVQIGVSTKRGDQLFNGSMCLTNRRLIFIGKYATKTLVDEHPLDSATGLTLATGKIVGTLGVKYGLKVEEYQCNAKVLASFVEKVKAQAVAGDSVPSPSGDSAVEELKKLADLHAQGILDDDEFAEAKQRIIDSM